MTTGQATDAALAALLAEALAVCDALGHDQVGANIAMALDALKREQRSAADAPIGVSRAS